MNNKADGFTALYERLSPDDEQLGESNSIVNQKQMLEDYAAKNGYQNCVHYTDDGYSGGSFDRPAWKKMMEDIDAGRISTVIAKDMSRIGRNYLEVGYYTEVLFSQKNIRFIAIANGVDSSNQSSSEFAPFLNSTLQTGRYFGETHTTSKAKKTRCLRTDKKQRAIQKVLSFFLCIKAFAQRSSYR